MIVDVDTLIDWWIITRDTVFFLIYLGVMAWFLYGNSINRTKAFILLCIYVVHIFLMKFSSKYEIILKHSFANRLEISELNRIAKQEEKVIELRKKANQVTPKDKELQKDVKGGMKVFHRHLNTQAISIEMLNKVNFKFNAEEGIIIFNESKIKRKITPISMLKLGEEQFADKDDKSLNARFRMKKAVALIIVRL